MRARGLTDIAVAELTGLHIKTWMMVKKGILRPGDNLVNILMKVLGDEVPLLFMGYYITEHPPRLVRADKFKMDIVSKRMHENIEKVSEKGGKLRY